MLLNAHSLHADDALPPVDSVGPDTYKPLMDQTMLNYVLRGEQIEDAGGILWTWKRILSGKLSDTEGIWLPTRLLVFQGVQFVTGIVLVGMVFAITAIAANRAEGFRDDLDPDLPDWVFE